MSSRSEVKECPECSETKGEHVEIPSHTQEPIINKYEMGAVTKSGRVVPGRFRR